MSEPGKTQSPPRASFNGIEFPLPQALNLKPGDRFKNGGFEYTLETAAIATKGITGWNIAPAAGEYLKATGTGHPPVLECRMVNSQELTLVAHATAKVKGPA